MKIKLLLVLSLIYVNVNALIINVPADFAKIQLAIGASSNGDTVLVQPGTYFENINFRGKKIVLTSLFYLNQDTSFICSTIINGSTPVYVDTASCVIFNHGEDSTTIIQGFTLTGGLGTKWTDTHGAGVYREGGGIISDYASPTIQFNIIKYNVVMNNTGVASTGGGGIRSGDGNPIIRNNSITNNQGKYGGGIVFNYCKGTVTNNVIAYNSGGQSYGGGGLWMTATDTNTVVNVINNVIFNNHVTGTGTYGGKGGAISNLAGKINLRNNIIWGNTQTSGGPLAVFAGSKIRAAYCDVQVVYPGAGNINVNPQFADTVRFLLKASSACVDSGDTNILYNDIASFPAMGTVRNDMGAYGGPNAFLLSVCPSASSGVQNNAIEEMEIAVSPMPVTDKMQVIFTSKEERLTEIILLNAGLQKIKVLAKDRLAEGKHNLSFGTENLENGIYFLQVRADNDQSIKKIILIR
jgi:hypothetical protein